MSVWRRYLAVATAGTLALVALTGALNWFVDPFWFYGGVTVTGVNAIKPEFPYRERESKPFIVARRQPSAVILGSSYAEIGLDPAHPALAVGGYDTYNFGLIGGSWRRIYCNFDFALRVAPLRRVILAVDATAMPTVTCDGDIGVFGPFDHLRNLLSIDTLKSSLVTLLQQRPSARTHDDNGLFFYTKRSASVFERFARALRKRVRERDPTAATKPATAPETNFSGLTTLIARAAGGGVEVIVVVHPRHAYVREVLIRNGAKAGYWATIRGLVAAIEDQARTSGVEVAVWDFADYDALTAEPVRRGRAMTYWQDPGHYNTAFGDAMFDRMFGCVRPACEGAPPFGHKLSTATLDGRIAAFDAARSDYISAHPEFTDNLADVLAGAGGGAP